MSTSHVSETGHVSVNNFQKSGHCQDCFWVLLFSGFAQDHSLTVRQGISNQVRGEGSECGSGRSPDSGHVLKVRSWTNALFTTDNVKYLYNRAYVQ